MSTSLLFPDGALTTPATFAVRPLSQRLPGTVGPAVEATPHGAVFEKPVALRFALNSSDIAPGIAFGELRVATLVDGQWQPLPTTYPAPGIVEGWTTHFSTFAIIAPCHVSGSGTSFPLSDCDAFTPTIQTSSPVSLEAKGASITLAMTIRPTAGASPVDFTVSGLSPGWTYFLSRDASSQLAPLTASPSGVLTFTQDIASPHHLLLMARHGSISLTAATCPQVGSWDAGTCTLTTDIASPPVYIEEDDLRLDCAGHTIGGATTASVGVYFYKRRGVAVSRCAISNADYGVIAGGAGLDFSSVSVSTPPGAVSGNMGFDFTSASELTVSDSEVTGFKTGLSAAGGNTVGFAANNGTNLSFSRMRFSVLGVPTYLTGTDGVTFDDVILDGTASALASGQRQATTPPGAIQIVTATNTVIRRLKTTGAMTAYGGVITTVESGVTIEGADIANANVGVRLDGPSPREVSQVTDSSFTNNTTALALNGGTNRLFHNNFIANGSPSVRAASAVELSDTDPNSSTFRQGNYWGRACPSSLFIAGIDTSRTDAKDSFPYAAASAWEGGQAPGCPIVLVAPTISVPIDGVWLSTASPTFEGLAMPSLSVELLEDGLVKGTTTALANGTFQLQASAPFSQGFHTLTARVRFNGRTSPESPAVGFTVDTIAPLPPTLRYPKPASVLAEATVAVVGSAEPDSFVLLREGASVLGGAPATNGAFVIVVPTFAPGAHTVTATARDYASNDSPASAPVTFTVQVPSPQSPTVGPRGRLAITSVTNSLNPFTPSKGETNQLGASGVVLIGPGQSGGNDLTAALNRKVVNLSSGQTIGVLTASARIPSPTRSQPQPAFTVTSTWNGTLPNGKAATPGAYLIETTVSLGRDVPSPRAPPTAGGLFPPPASFPAPGTFPPPTQQPGGGEEPNPVPGPVPSAPNCGGAARLDEGCIVDSLVLTQIVAMLPPPTDTTVHCCSNHPVAPLWLPVPCLPPPEVCNGVDDNCNGVIDEHACEPSLGACSCVPVACGNHHGTIPDGCGRVLVCP